MRSEAVIQTRLDQLMDRYLEHASRVKTMMYDAGDPPAQGKLNELLLGTEIYGRLMALAWVLGSMEISFDECTGRLDRSLLQ